MSTATNFFAGSTHSIDCEHNKVDERMDYAINLGGTADTLRTLRLSARGQSPPCTLST
jgi:hypothetical protein